MRILAVNYEYTLTGSTVMLLRLAEYLREAGHEVSVCAALPAEGPIKEQYRERGFTVLDPPLPSHADLAICNTVMTAPLLIDLSGSARTIWWLHEERFGLPHLLQNPRHVAAFERASAIVFPVAYLRDAVYRSFIYDKDPSRFVIIPTGIPPIDIQPASRPQGGALRVVSIGSIYPRKRHEDLIRAMALYPGPAKCVIAGKYYTLPEDCLNFIAQHPEKFELVGEVDHSAALKLLAGADVFCLPSDSEVMPLTSLEAAMLERPMVLSDLSVYDGIWRHGRNCLMHPIGAIGMLAQCLAMLAGNPELRARLGAAARRTAAPYTEAAFFARFDALLSSL
jgi:glycosyltransferase involved in cell wall biosynthesis